MTNKEQLKKPELRFLLTPARSGTTAFLHTIAQSPHVDTASGSIKKYLRAGGHEDYSIYESVSKFPYLFYRVAFGRGSVAECAYNPFRTDKDIANTRPLFLFRDPVQTFNSWKRVGKPYDTLDLFTIAYQHTLDMYYHCKKITEKATCVAYEHLATRAEQIFWKIFCDWGIPYDEKILIWNTKLGEGTIKAYDLEEQRTKLERQIHTGMHDSLIVGPQTYRLVENEMILTLDEIYQIKIRFQANYEEISSHSAHYFSVR